MKNPLWLMGPIVAVAAAALAVFAFLPHSAFSEEGGVSDKSAAESLDGKGRAKEKDDMPSVPVIPKDLSSLSEAERIRLNLELMRQDTQNKIKALQQAKSAYDLTRKRIEKQLAEVKEQRRLLDETLQHEKETKETRLKEALAFVEKMEPRKSAPVIEAMDRDLVVALFKRLPPRNVTRILENVSPRKATEFMEYYTRIRSGREFALLRELGLCKADSEDGDGAAGGARGPASKEEKKPGDDSSKSGKKTIEAPGTQRVGGGASGTAGAGGEGSAGGRTSTVAKADTSGVAPTDGKTDGKPDEKQPDASAEPAKTDDAKAGTAL